MAYHGWHRRRERDTYQKGRRPSVPQTVVVTDARCAVCGAPVVETVNRYGGFHHCAACCRPRTATGAVVTITDDVPF